MIKKFKYRWNNNDNSHEYKPEKINNAKKLIKELCPPWVAEEEPDFSQSISDPFLDDEFTYLEFETALYNFNLKSTPGKDNLDYKIIYVFSTKPKEHFYLY